MRSGIVVILLVLGILTVTSYVAAEEATMVKTYSDRPRDKGF